MTVTMGPMTMVYVFPITMGYALCSLMIVTSLKFVDFRNRKNHIAFIHQSIDLTPIDLAKERKFVLIVLYK